MPEPQIRFIDGEAYERSMGVWSRSAGEVFLNWLHPDPGLTWLDVGCGSGVFTELIVERAAPAEVQGIDPSEEQLAFARRRPAARIAEFRQGSAMELPFADDSFDAAVMALVLFFVPDPAKGVSEMVRVVRPGGLVAAYLWDLPPGFPYEPIYAEMRAMGISPPRPPSAEVSGMTALRELWSEAGLADVETQTIVVSRTFAGFDEFWRLSTSGMALRGIIAGMSPADLAALKSRVQSGLPVDGSGQVTYQSVANAIKGRGPG